MSTEQTESEQAAAEALANEIAASEQAEAEAIAASKLLAEQDAEAQAAALIADEPTPAAPQVEQVYTGQIGHGVPRDYSMGPSGAVAIQAFLAKKQAEEDAKALAG